MRVAIAGLGGAALRGHLPALLRLQSERRLRLVAAADTNVNRRRAAGDVLHDVPLFETAEEMLESVASDLFVVAAEPAAHAQLMLLGIAHRQHIVCEKPLTLTRANHELVAAAHGARADVALAAVHQYRYSPTWIAVSRWARSADRLRVPLTLKVDIQRDGTDRHAATRWRSEIGASGGMLADHGVHFLALARTISEDLNVLAATRAFDSEGLEQSTARVGVGFGLLELRVSARATERRTRLDLAGPRLQFSWSDEAVRVTAGGHTFARWRTDALSDRRHVDHLYLPLYRDIATNVRDPSWRGRRAAEALAVGRALIALLELASVATPP